MEIRVLRYFLAVAREENVSRAAESLHLSQPTLSRQLMDLEAELGKRLFLRGSRKITLTEDGLLLRRRASEIVELVDRTESELRESDELLAGEVHIGGGRRGGYGWSGGWPGSSGRAAPRFATTCSAGIWTTLPSGWSRGCSTSC